MRDDEYEHALIEGAPAKDVVLAQRPVAMQAFLELYEIAALAETHLLGQAGELVEIWRIVGYAPYPRLRQVFQFHLIARSDFRERATSATVPRDQTNQLYRVAQVLSVPLSLRHDAADTASGSALPILHNERQ